MRATWIAGVVMALTTGGTATAQTWGQPQYPTSSVTWGQAHGGWAGGLTEWDGRAYSATGHAATGNVNGPVQAYGGHGHTYGGDHAHAGGYGDPRAYRPPAWRTEGYRGHDRGGRYGYSSGNRWTRWSSPPGRGYYDAYGYNDDRPPRGPDRRRLHEHDCRCGVGPYLYDR